MKEAMKERKRNIGRIEEWKENERKCAREGDKEKKEEMKTTIKHQEGKVIIKLRNRQNKRELDENIDKNKKERRK